jgi:hypothetical protein
MVQLIDNLMLEILFNFFHKKSKGQKDSTSNTEKEFLYPFQFGVRTLKTLAKNIC